MTFKPPKGTDDLLPPASRRWRRILRVWDDLTERYGYELAMTPIFEATDLFARGVGESTEVVQKQMFTWEDRGGRSMTLRPEATAGLIRAYLEAGSAGVMKVAYAGPMFRYEQPQAGRRRQFLQVDLEYIGEPSPRADVEVIEVGHRFYQTLGIDDIRVAINSLGDQHSRAAYRPVLSAYLEERRDELCEDCQRRVVENPLRVLDCKVDGPRLGDAPVPIDHLNAESAEHYLAVKEGLDAAMIPWSEDRRLVRGLDYYTHTVFEYSSPSYEAAQAELGGGGRYDGLAEALGGPFTPAVGFALGLDRVVLAMGDAVEAAPLDFFVVLAEEERRPEADKLLADLRARGLRADQLVRRASVKAQFRAADRRGATSALVVGRELDDGKVTVRRLADGAEEIIAVEEAAEWAQRR